MAPSNEQDQLKEEVEVWQLVYHKVGGGGCGIILLDEISRREWDGHNQYIHINGSRSDLSRSGADL